MKAGRRSYLDRTVGLAQYRFGCRRPLTGGPRPSGGLNRQPARALASWAGPALCWVGRSDLAHDSFF
jgi:hypothetical protein